MRKKIAVAALGLGLAASFAPLSPASAVCTGHIQDVVDVCTRVVCGPPNSVIHEVFGPGPHLDCFD